MTTFQIKPGVASSFAAALLMLASIGAPAFAHEYRAGDIEVIHPIAPPTPPGAPMAAGYLEIVNHGDQDDRLLGGSVYFAHELQLHETTVEGDVSRMRQLTEGLVIPAGETVRFQPMGKHLMFTELAEPLVEGTRQSATLSFEKAGDLVVEFAVEQPESGGMESMDSMDHGEMEHDNMNHGEMEQGNMKHGDMKQDAMTDDGMGKKEDEQKQN